MSLAREFGRIGQVRLDHFNNEEQAGRALKRLATAKRKRGYRQPSELLDREIFYNSGQGSPLHRGVAMAAQPRRTALWGKGHVLGYRLPVAETALALDAALLRSTPDAAVVLH